MMSEPFAYTPGELLEQRVKRLEEWVQRVESEERMDIFRMGMQIQKLERDAELTKQNFVRLIKILEDKEDEDEQSQMRSVL